LLLQGKNAVVTGARTGIGRAVVEKFAANGANIWACGRNPDAGFEADMRDIAEKYGVWVKPVCFDMTDKAQIAAGAKQILDERLPIDILVNNAAVNQISLFMQTGIERIEELFAVDYFAPLILTQKLAKRMIRQKSGNIVNILSARAMRPAPGRLAYSSAKAALKLATETLALEFAGSGIRVNAVAPGQVGSTRMMNELKEHNTTLNNTLDRFGKPEEIADSVLFLASGMSSYITGFTVETTGGGG
jgi:3-oxoacyl-[acyl-carrier protein] reductase